LFKSAGTSALLKLFGNWVAIRAISRAKPSLPSAIERIPFFSSLVKLILNGNNGVSAVLMAVVNAVCTVVAGIVVINFLIGTLFLINNSECNTLLMVTKTNFHKTLVFSVLFVPFQMPI
jgi:hypothetical protein